VPQREARIVSPLQVVEDERDRRAAALAMYQRHHPSKEIFNLNKGRIQPDGGSLVDPAVLRPGWVLVLPPDAAGPRVLIGVLPTGRANPGGAAPTVAAGGQDQSGSSNFDAAVRFAGVIAVLAVMLVAVGLLRRGMRLKLPVTARRYPTNAPVAIRSDRPSTTARHVVDETDSRGPVPPRPRGTTDRPADRRIVEHRAGLAEPRRKIRPPAPVASDPMDADSSSTTSTKATTSRAARPVPAVGVGGPHPRDQVLEVELIAASGQDRATVRLAGIRMPRATLAWAWLHPDEAAPPSPTYVALGANNEGAFCVDLAQAPDVLTVTGDAVAAQRLAAALARQLVGASVPVTVVGTALRAHVAGVRAVRAMTEVEDDTHDPGQSHIVFCSPGDDDAATIRRLIARSAPRTVLVLVGGSRTSRWSVELRPQAW
jgi:hypothetical protein